jgi:hypothetical protein
LDDNPYQSTVVPSYSMLDPTNPQAEYGNGAEDIRHRVVGAVIFEPQTHFHGIKDYALGGWRIAPLIQAQTGLPFTPYVSGSVSGLTVPSGTDGCVPTGTATTCAVNAAYKGLNGSGSSADRLPWIQRDSSNFPRTVVIDVRVGKNFYIHAARFENARFEVFAEIFNVANHQNITGLTDEAYTLSGTTLTTYNNYGDYTNSNSNYTYSPRQVQVAARLHF